MSQLSGYLQNLVDDGVISGGIALIDDGAGSIDRATVGAMSMGGPPMRDDAIFRIQSMTKAVMAVATLRLVQQGRMQLDDPVQQWLPELSEPQVLRSVDGALDAVVPATGPITVRHLLTCTSGHGIGDPESSLGHEMVASGVEAGPQPYGIDADEWMQRIGRLPLAHQPGDGWRYHHPFSILGVLLHRATGGLVEHLDVDVFGPIGMSDTGFWVPEADRHRLPAAYRKTASGLEEVDALGGGANSGYPGYAPWHEELVSAADDYLAFARMLRDGGRLGAEQYLDADLLGLMTSDQVNADAKTADSFGPQFWRSAGWGFGVGIDNGAEGTVAGRFGWSGGQGTDFTVDPASGRITLMLTQVELGPETFGPVLGLRDPDRF